MRAVTRNEVAGKLCGATGASRVNSGTLRVTQDERQGHCGLTKRERPNFSRYPLLTLGISASAQSHLTAPAASFLVAAYGCMLNYTVDAVFGMRAGRCYSCIRLSHKV